MITKRRIVGTPVVLLLCACLLGASAVAGPVVNVTNPSMVTLGNSFTVNINVTGAVDVYAFQFDLEFDPTILQATSVSEGSFLPSGGTTFFLGGTVDNTAGVVSSVADTLLGPVSGVNGDGDLVDVSFDAVGTGSSELSLANEIFLDSTLTDITSTVTFAGNAVTVLATTTVPEPSTLAIVLFGIAGLAVICRSKISPTKGPN